MTETTKSSDIILIRSSGGIQSTLHFFDDEALVRHILATLFSLVAKHFPEAQVAQALHEARDLREFDEDEW